MRTAAGDRKTTAILSNRQTSPASLSARPNRDWERALPPAELNRTATRCGFRLLPADFLGLVRSQLRPRAPGPYLPRRRHALVTIDVLGNLQCLYAVIDL